MARTDRAGQHIPVMPDEVLAWLAPQAGETVLDGTVGMGGHAELLLKAVGPQGRLIGLDRDSEVLQEAGRALAWAADRVTLLHANYSEAPAVLSRLGVPAVDRTLLDLGVSSWQIDRPERGFSHSRDGPLDMRMDPGQPLTAAELIANSSEQELVGVFRAYGEERNARRIARSIVEARANETIKTTGRLAELVRRSVRGRSRLHPATRVFQALRIAVNDELGDLERGLEGARGILTPGGRLVVVTFHSLEDRIVKRTFRAWAASGDFWLVRKKVVKPGRQECERNPRSRSAKLRVIERLPAREATCP